MAFIYREEGPHARKVNWIMDKLEMVSWTAWLIGALVGFVNI